MIGNASQLKKEYEKNCREQRIKNLKHLRENIAKISASDFCKELGIPKSNFSDIENGKEGRNLSLYNIQAYKAYFKENHSLDISTDFLLGYTDILTTDSNIQMIHKTIGLSEQAINKIISLEHEQKKVLDMIICDSNFNELIVKIQNYLHSGNVGILIPDMTKQEEIEHENDEYKVNGLLQYDTELIHQYIVSEIFKRILNNIYEPYKKIASNLYIDKCITDIFYAAFMFQQYNEFYKIDIKEAETSYNCIKVEDPEHKILKYDLEYILKYPDVVWKEIFKNEPPEDYEEFLYYKDYTYYDL